MTRKMHKNRVFGETCEHRALMKNGGYPMTTRHVYVPEKAKKKNTI